MMEDYIDGDEEAGEELVSQAFVNAAVSAVFALGGAVGKKLVQTGAKSLAAKVIGSELTESLLKNGANPDVLEKNIRRLQKLNVANDIIRDIAENVGSEGLERLGRLSGNSKIPESLIKALAGNEAAVRNLTDQNLGKFLLFEHTANSHIDDVVRFFGEKGDDFLHAYERFGSSVYEPLRALGSDAIVDLERHGDSFLDLFAAHSDDLTGLYSEYGSRAIDAGITYGDNFFRGIATVDHFIYVIDDNLTGM